VDRLVGRHDKAARRALKRHGWGVPGLAWDPTLSEAADA
jgi:peptide deformylase